MNSCLGIHQQEGTLKLDLVIQGLKTMKTNLFALMLLAMFAVVGCSDAEEAGSVMAAVSYTHLTLPTKRIV